MADERPSVVIIEDDKFSLEWYQHALTNAGIAVLRSASNVTEALQVKKELKELKKKDMLPDFVLALDMNLRKGVYTGFDGKILSNEFWEFLPSLVIFSISSYNYELDNVKFIGTNPKNLIDAINKL